MNSQINIHSGNWIISVFKTGKWYILSSIFTKGIGLLLLPIYTRYLSPSDYGILNTLTSIAQIIPIFLSLYLDSAFGRFYHDIKHDNEKLKDLFSTVYWFVAIWGGLVLIGTLCTAPLWTRHFVQVPFFYIALALVPTLFLQIAQLGIIFLRQSLDSKRTTFLDISTALISIFITLPLLMFFNLGVLARLIGAIFPAVFLFIYYTWFFSSRGLLGFRFDRESIKRCLFYSVPMIPNITAGWIASLSDRLVLAKFANQEAVGLYSLAMNFAMLMYMAQDAVTQVTGPLQMSGLIHDKDNTKRKMAGMSLLLLAGMLTADLALTLFSTEVTRIFATKSYAGAASIIGICGFAYVLSCQYRLFTDVVSYHKKTWVISSGGILMAVVSLVANLSLVPRFGYNACAFSFVFATFVYTLWLYIWAQSVEHIDFLWGRAGLLFIMFIAGMIAAHNIDKITLFTITEKICILAGFGFTSFLLTKDKIGKSFS